MKTLTLQNKIKSMLKNKEQYIQDKYICSDDIKIITGIFFSWEGKEEKIFNNLKELLNKPFSKYIKIYLTYNNETKDNEYIQKTRDLLTEKNIEFSELNLKTRKMTGWKPKLYIYKQALIDHEKVIYMDLDVTMLKGIDQKFVNEMGDAKIRFSISKRPNRTLNCLLYMNNEFSEYIDKAIKKSTDFENCDDEESLFSVLESDKQSTCGFGPIVYEYFRV